MNASAKNSKASTCRTSRTRRSMRPSAPALKTSSTCSSSGSIDHRRSSSGSDTVSEKLEALKNLISPAAGKDGDGEIAAEQLFQDTASYILRLRSQVVVLQRLVQLYGRSTNSSDEADVIDGDTVL